MGNQINQENQKNDPKFYDQADGKLNKSVKKSNDETNETENAGETYSENLMSDADAQVRETEDASLQDDSYAFDESNTDNEEYHDAAGGDEFDIGDDEDFVQ